MLSKKKSRVQKKDFPFSYSAIVYVCIKANFNINEQIHFTYFTTKVPYWEKKIIFAKTK